MRGLGQKDQGHRLNDGQAGAEAEHDPPAGRRGHEDVVDQVGQQETDSDAQLVERDEHAAIGAVRHLGDVEALAHGGEADGKADNKTAN